MLTIPVLNVGHEFLKFLPILRKFTTPLQNTAAMLLIVIQNDELVYHIFFVIRFSEKLI